MQARCCWQGGLKFLGAAGDHQVVMDTMPPLGTNAGMSPKQLVLAGLCGCTAMDVAAHLRKHGQSPDGLDVAADAPTIKGKEPSVFVAIELTFRVAGAVDRAVLLEAVHLSQTLYCGVSAMLARACPIRYRVELNGVEIGNGAADFPA